MGSWQAIPFELPEHFLPGLLNGTLRRIGTTIRNVETGKIVGHVQETSYWHEALHSTTSLGGKVVAEPVSILLQGGQFFSSVAANFQLEQVKEMLTAMRLLTHASLAASVTGIGVSAIGFHLMSRRLDRLSNTLSNVNSEIISARLSVEKVEFLMLKRDWARTESLFRRGEEAWVRSDARSVWRDLDGPLDLEHRYWRGLVGIQESPSIFLDQRFTLEQAAAAYEAAASLASMRIQVLLLMEELAAAQIYAQEFYDWHERAVSKIRPIEIAAARSQQMAREKSITEPDARTEIRNLATPLVERMRETSVHIGMRPTLIRLLREREISGRAYLEAIRQGSETPILILKA